MKRTILLIAILMLSSGCAKRYDSATKIHSTTDTTISHDGTEAISQEVPMANGLYRQNLGTGPLVPAVSGVTMEAHVENHAVQHRSLKGKDLIEVVFIKRNGQFSVLENVATGERFQMKGDWGATGDKFKIEK